MNLFTQIKNWFEDNGIWFNQSKVYFVLFLSLLLIGIYLVYPKDWAFSGGEFHSLFAVKGITEFGIPRMPSGVIYWRNFISHYIQAVPVGLFGMSEFSMRLPFFILFFPFIFIFFKYVNKSYNLSAAFLSFGLIISSGWFLRYVQNIRFFSLALILLFFSYYFFDRYFYKKGNWKHFFYFLLFSSIGILNSQLGWSVIILPVIYLLLNIREIKLFYKKAKHKKALISSIALLIVFYLSSQIPVRVIGEVSFLEGAQSFTGIGRGWGIVDKIVYGLLSIFNFNDNYFDIFIDWFQFLFYFFIVVLVFLVIFNRKNKQEKMLPFLFFFSFFLVISLIDKNREPPRIISVLSPYFYLGIGVGLAFVYNFLKKLLNLDRTKSVVLFIFILIVSTIAVNQSYLVEYIEANDGCDEILTGPLNSSYEPFFITSSESANRYVLDNYREGDTIISTKIFGWDNYYLKGRLDYTLMTEDLSKAAPGLIAKTGSNYRLIYHNVEVIRSLSELKNIIDDNNRVWLITNDRAEEYNNQSIENFLSRVDNIVYQEGNTSFKVFLYEN